MGTRYSVQIAEVVGVELKAAIGSEIESELERILDMASTYRPDSELSRLNQAPVNRWIPVSEELMRILQIGQEIGEHTGGMFDVGVGELVNRWGFGPENYGTPSMDFNSYTPRVQAVRQAPRLLLRRRPSLAIKKRTIDMLIDLSAIVKGYAVDRLAAILDKYSIDNYLVDIGGEILVSGESTPGQAWRLAIESPQQQRGDKPFFVFPLLMGAAATSGSYRNYYLKQGKRYSHIIDPSTGVPVSHQLLSVTVLHKTAMQADAIATALMVMGPIKGPVWARQQQISAYFIACRGDEYHVETSGQFTQ